jgi:hypothetical protein
MTNNNNNNETENKMTKLDKLVQTFMKRGHSWSNSIRLAKSALEIQLKGGKIQLRKFVRVDD